MLNTKESLFEGLCERINEKKAKDKIKDHAATEAHMLGTMRWNGYKQNPVG